MGLSVCVFPEGTSLGLSNFVILMMALCKKKPKKPGEECKYVVMQQPGLPHMLCLWSRCNELAGIRGDGQGLAVPWHRWGTTRTVLGIAGTLGPAERGACCSLALLELTFGEQIPHQMRRMRVWWTCTVCGGSFLAMAGDVAGAGQLPLITDGDVTTGHQEFTSHSLSSVYDLEKNPTLYKRDAVRDFYQKITIFLGMIHYLKLANICVIKYWWCWGGVIEVWDRALSSHLSWLLFLWLCESSLAFHLVFLPVEGRWVCVNNWERQLMNILTKNNYYL